MVISKSISVDIGRVVMFNYALHNDILGVVVNGDTIQCIDFEEQQYINKVHHNSLFLDITECKLIRGV